MKFQIVSDLHREFGTECLSPGVFTPSHVAQDANVLVFAGDTHVNPNGLAVELARYPEELIKIVVFGNHEFYANHYEKIKGEYRKKVNELCKNVHILDNEYVDLGDIRVFGSTLWTDLDEGRDAQLARRSMNDYNYIAFEGRVLRPSDTMKMHSEAVTWLARELAIADDMKKVVVTHHAPSFKSISDKFYDKELSGAYASDLEGVMTTWKPRLWIHGHTHSCTTYVVDKTTVVCNCQGYINSRNNIQNTGFTEQLVVEVK